MARTVTLDGERVSDPVAVLAAILKQCAEWAEDGTPSLYIGGRTYAAEVILQMVADTICPSGSAEYDTGLPQDGGGVQSLGSPSLCNPRSTP